MVFRSKMIAPIKKRKADIYAVYQLKVVLCDSKPSIWRRFQVPGNITLLHLHGILQVVMGWTNCHLHQFRNEGDVYSVSSPGDFHGTDDLDERRYTLADIAPCEKDWFIYEYDFGDAWEHEVLVEAHLPPMVKRQAICMDGKNACPPDDCGGIPGYYNLLEAVSNPKHKDRQQLLDWLGGPFDPKHFDIQGVNARLKGLKL